MGSPGKSQPAPSIVFQPIVDLMTGTTIGYEALARLAHHEDEGFAALKEAAQKAHALHETLADAQRLALYQGALRPPGTFLFINVTRRLASRLTAITANSSRQWQDIVLEIPESDRHLARWLDILTLLRARGAHVAIDDWGVGQADPLRLAQLKPNWLKIDLALTHRVVYDPSMVRLIGLLVDWLSPAGTRIIAEGIETKEQLVRLRSLGVRYGQGFLLARPSREWITNIPVPEAGTRLGQLQSIPLALSQAFPLSDDMLALIEENHDVIAPLIQQATTALAEWIHRTRAASQLEGVVPVAHFLDLLQQHFATLTRGYLGSEDLDRSAAIVRAHHRYGVDLSWYVLAYREFQGRITAALRQGGHHDLAEAMRELFSWDMGIFLHAYQKTLDQDDVTRLMRRRTFFEQMSLDIQQQLLGNRTGAFALLQLKGLARVIERQGRHVSQRLLQQVGEILQSYTSAQTLVGRLDGDEIGVWISSATPQTLDQMILRLTIDIKQKAPPLRGEVQTVWLGQDGTTAEALYAAANRQMMKDATSSPSPSF